MCNELAISDGTSNEKHLVDMATEWSEHNGSTQAGKSKNVSINYENNYVFFPTQHKSNAFIVIHCIQKPTNEGSSHNGQAYNNRQSTIIQYTTLNIGKIVECLKPKCGTCINYISLVLHCITGKTYVACEWLGVIPRKYFL